MDFSCRAVKSVKALARPNGAGGTPSIVIAYKNEIGTAMNSADFFILFKELCGL